MQSILKKGSLKRNIFFMLLGNGVFAFSQWLQLSLISKYCSIETLGFFTLALSVISPVFMLTGLQLRTLIITDVHSQTEFGTFFKLRIWTSILSLSIIIIIALLLSNLTLLPYLLLLTFQKVLEGLSELFNSKQQQNENIEILTLSLFLKGASIILSIFIGLVFFKSLFIGLSLILFFYVIILYFNDYKNYKKGYHQKIILNLPFDKIKNLAKRGLPLGIVLLIISLNANISKYFLEIYAGTKIQAIFSSISYVLVIGIFILDSLGQVFVPRLSKFYYDKEYLSFQKYSFNFVLLSFLIGSALFLFSLFFGEDTLRFLFNAKISAYSGFLSKYLMAGILIFISSSLGYILTSMGEFKVQPYINFFILIVNFILSYFLIKHYELIGVIITLTICFSLQIIITLSIIINRVVTRKKQIVI